MSSATTAGQHADAVPATGPTADPDKAARLAAMSKAMGALFLKDRVERLEQDVDTLRYARPSRGGRGGGGGGERGVSRGRGRGEAESRGGGRGGWDVERGRRGGGGIRGGSAGAGRGSGRGARRGGGRGAGRGGPIDSASPASARKQHDLGAVDSDDPVRRRISEWRSQTAASPDHLLEEGYDIETDDPQQSSNTARIRIVDVSVLIYSLRTIHDWLKRGKLRLIVPQEAFNVLDLLKKGDHQLNFAARKATRFLEEKLSAIEPHTTAELATLPCGLFVQGHTEKLGRKELMKRREAVLKREAEAATQVAEAEKRNGEAEEGRSQPVAISDLSEGGAPTVEQENTQSASKADPQHRSGKDSFAIGSAPIHIVELLACTAWFDAALSMSTPSIRSTSPSRITSLRILLSSPPELIPVSHGEPTDSKNDSASTCAPPSYAIRTDGKETRRWLAAYGLDDIVEVLPTASSWLSVNQHMHHLHIAAHRHHDGKGGHHHPHHGHRGQHRHAGTGDEEAHEEQLTLHHHHLNQHHEHVHILTHDAHAHAYAHAHPSSDDPVLG